MVSDKEVVRQMLERDVVNIYRSLPTLLGNSASSIMPFVGLFEDKITAYADVGIDYVLAWLFGNDASGDIDEAATVAKLIANDKIEEYRKRAKEMKDSGNTNNT